MNQPIELNENAQKLTGGWVNTNIDTEILHYRWNKNEIDYSNLLVQIRNNVYSNERSEIPLNQVLGLASQREHYEKCSSLAPLLYGFEMVGTGEIETPLLYKRKSIERYRQEKRNVIPVVNYANKPVNQDQTQWIPNPIVVLDIDFKADLGWLEGTRIDHLKNKITNFFNQEKSAVFLYESVSGIGFHLGMAFTSNEINPTTYAKAYNCHAKKLVDFIDEERFHVYIDYSVCNLNVDFYLGYSHTVNFKNPSETLYVEYIHEIERQKENHSLTATSFQDDFRLTHYLKLVDRSKTYFDDYDEWVNMIYAVVCAFGANYDKAYHWFEQLSSLSPAYDPVADIDKFNEIYESEPDIACGINYIIRHLFPTGRIMNYIGYSFGDVREYYQQNESFLKPDNNDGSLVIDSWISELDGQFDINDNLIIESPPNSGKSTYFLNQDNVIFLAPTIIVRDDLASNHPEVFVINSNEQIILNRKKYLGVYDSIYTLVQSGLDLKKYTLVFDEKHEIFCSANVSFRHRVIYKIVQSLGMFKNVIFLTGTDIDFPFTNIQFKKLTIRKSEPFEPLLELVSTDTPLQTMVAEILMSPGKQVCLINNKSLIEKVKNLLTEKGRKVKVFTSDTKEYEEQQEILKENKIPDGTIILGTQMIIEGISFKDSDITFLRFYQPMLAEYVAQFSFRARNESSPPKVVMYVKTKDFRFQAKGNLQNAYLSVTEETNSLFDCIGNLPRGDENDYQRYYKQSNGKDKTLLPIIQYYNNDPELDLLLLGNMATDLASLNLGKDLFGLIVQLLKWNFRFQFRQTTKTDVLTIHTRETREKQIDILKCRFEDLTYKQNITEKQVFLFRAICALNWIDEGYFRNMIEDDRAKLFSDKDVWKKFVVQVAVIAKGKGLTEQHLEWQISDLNVSGIINKIAKIKTIDGFPKISHPLLITHLGMDSKEIKSIKKHLAWCYKIKNNSVNGHRSFTLTQIDHPFEQRINWGKFEGYDNNLPF